MRHSATYSKVVKDKEEGGKEVMTVRKELFYIPFRHKMNGT